MTSNMISATSTKALETLHSRIGNLMALLAASALISAVAILGATADIRHLNEDQRKLREAVQTIPLDRLQETWEADALYLQKYWSEYDKTMLEPAIKLAFLLTIVQSSMSLQLREQEIDTEKIERFTTEIGLFNQKLKDLRFSNTRLENAAKAGMSIRKFEEEEWAAYANYLDFEASVSEWAQDWTRIAKSSLVIRHIGQQFPEGTDNEQSILIKLIHSPEGKKLLSWSEHQLVRKSDAIGDFVSLVELYPSDEFARQFAQFLHDIDSAATFPNFRTLRDFGLSYAWVKESEQTKPISAFSIKEIVIPVLQSARVDSISDLMKKLRVSTSQATNANKQYKVPIPFFEGEWPLRSLSWVLIPANLILVMVLVRLQRRAIEIMQTELRSADSAHMMSSTWSYSFIRDRNFIVSIWDTIRDAACISGLSICSGLLYFSLPPASLQPSSVIVLIGLFILICALVWKYWLYKPEQKKRTE